MFVNNINKVRWQEVKIRLKYGDHAREKTKNLLTFENVSSMGMHCPANIVIKWHPTQYTNNK